MKRYKFKKNFTKSIERRCVRRLLLLSKHEPDDYLLNLPPLKSTDRFLLESDNLNDSFLNRGMEINEFNLPIAYMNTAVIMLTMIQYTNSNGVRDSLIYPALFSFRHYLELIMKDTLIRFRRGELADCIIHREHNLIVIWNELSQYIEDGVETNVIAKLINEVNMIDPSSEVFRYPYQIREFTKVSPDIKQTRLNNIKKLKETMLKIYRFMDGVNSHADELG
jgi:hypothetical protein